MRNAERFLAQGKIASAIGEFRQVVTHDPRDFGTMNMLGDLYVKNSQMRPAVDCYKAVAEHYAKQGFAHKAIAVYNKVSKIQPNTTEVTLRLAELYKEKGSIMDARSHFEQVADQYQKAGRKIEALDVWKQVANLDPNNSAAFVTIGEGYAGENCREAAAEAFSEAGRRYIKSSDHENAFKSFGRSLEFDPESAEMLGLYVESAFESGNAAAANSRVIEAHEKFPYNREIHSLLVDCHIRMGDLEAAERTLVKLIETEPASYPKLLELGRLYLAANDAASAARVLSMSSEHMLMEGQAEELCSLVTGVLALEPEHLEALRMMVRCASWLKDESGMRASLTSMAKAARSSGSLEDERFALSQLVMIIPQDTELADRLKEVNAELGVEDDAVAENLFDKQFTEKAASASLNGHVLESSNGNGSVSDFALAEEEAAEADLDESGFAFDVDEIEGPNVEVLDAAVVTGNEEPEAMVDDVVTKEIEGIRFYIESGFSEIAEKAIDEFCEEFGDRPEIAELRAMLKISADEAVVQAAPVQHAAAKSPAAVTNGDIGTISGAFDLHDLRSELGLDDIAAEDTDGDYETHYHTAVAYQEMYLLEDAIKEFQQAVSLVEPSDGTRRFFQCANLLGHCFMQLGKPNLAVRWFTRTLESSDTTDDERLGIWYELASAYEADGDHDNASRYYEQVYAENINFRDVASRVNSLVATG